jgi:hypothetical protein
VRAWAGQAEPRDRLTSRDYSPIPAVTLSPPKLQMRNVAVAIVRSRAGPMSNAVVPLRIVARLPRSRDFGTLAMAAASSPRLGVG